MVYVALKTGLRIGELLGLEWGDIDLKAQIISVKRSIVKGITGSPKSNKVRYIPFSTQTGEVLQKWKKVSGPVFTKIGIPINQKSPYRALWRYRDRAGLPRVGWAYLQTYVCITTSHKGSANAFDPRASWSF